MKHPKIALGLLLLAAAIAASYLVPPRDGYWPGIWAAFIAWLIILWPASDSSR